MWYEQINIMSDSLEYWVSRSETKPIVQNNRYLVPMEVNMHQMQRENNVVPKLRTSTRDDTDRSATNNEEGSRIGMIENFQLCGRWMKTKEDSFITQ